MRRMNHIRTALAPILLAASTLFLSGCGEQLKAHGTVMNQPAPEVRLASAGQKPFVLSEQRGKIVVLFFGYTHCGDVCPTTMAHIAQAIDRIGKTRVPIQTVFISVDPKRDGGAVAARYAHMFHPEFIGVTGSPAELKAVEKDFHVWSKSMPSDKHGNYEVAHSSEIFIIAPKGRIRILEDWDIPVSDLTDDLRKVS